VPLLIVGKRAKASEAQESGLFGVPSVAAGQDHRLVGEIVAAQLRRASSESGVFGAAGLNTGVPHNSQLVDVDRIPLQ
jgi:hypothetical protein